MGDVSIQRPGGVNVGINNPGEIIYLKGNESTDGSIRLIFTAGDPSAHIESRASGVWNDTGFRFSSSSVEIGRDMSISAVGGFIETVNLSEMVGHLKSLIPHIQFDANGTSSQPGHMPILDVRETIAVFPGPATGEIVGTTIGQTFSASPSKVLHSAAHTVGSVSATSEVQVSYYKGTDNTGSLLNRFNIPASAMVANQPLTIVYDSDFGFEDIQNIFFEFVSANNISLATNAAGDVITSQDGHTLAGLDIMLDEFVLANDLSFTLDNDLNFVIHNRF